MRGMDLLALAGVVTLVVLVLWACNEQERL